MGQRRARIARRWRTTKTEMLVSQRITAERLLLLGWSRAILLQLAHPLIAEGVYDHSDFRASPLAAARRLHQTVGSMLALTFGDVTASDQALTRIRAIHTRVHGVLADPVGPYQAGTPYSAEDPLLVLWVHATVVESMLMVYQLAVGPLAAADLDTYCDEAAWVATALGAQAEAVPRTWPRMNDYIDQTLRSGAIVVSPHARELYRALMWPSLAAVAPGSAWLNRLLTAAMLPPAVRAQYGLEMTPRRARFAARVFTIVRRLRVMTPNRLAQWPHVRRLAEDEAAARRLHAPKRV
jgi:uncharacterized protein (DUF2236 family)